MDWGPKENLMKRKKTKKQIVADRKERLRCAAIFSALRKEMKEALFNHDIIDHLQETDKMKWRANDYFRRYNKCFDAIRDHIDHGGDVVFFELDGIIVSHRGSGAAINFREARVYGKDPTHYRMTIEIEYFCEGQVESYDPDFFHEKYDIDVPIDLERNFTKKKFKAWIEELRVVRDAKKYQEERKMVEGFIIRHRDFAKSLLKMGLSKEYVLDQMIEKRV